MRPRLTYANVISSLALFLVLGGGAALAVDGPLPGQNQVGSADIINNDVQSADIRDANVNTADIRSGAVTTGKIGDGEVRTADVLNDGLTGADIDESTLDVGAYARVNPSTCTGTPGTCLFEQSHGVSSVTRDFNGTYCVTAPGIDADETPAAVTVDRSNTAVPEGNASAMTREAAGCGPTGTGFFVITQRQPNITVDSGGGVNNATAVGPADFANDVAFTIVIP